MKKLLLLALTVVLAVSCSPSLDDKIIMEDGAGKPYLEMMSVKEKESFLRGMMAEGFKSADEDFTKGKTYQYMINQGNILIKKDSIRDAEAEALRLEQEKIAKEQEEARKAKQMLMEKAVKLTVYKKKFVPSDIYSGRYESYNCLYVKIQNLSSKKVIAYSGKIVAYDIFGDKIWSGSVKDDKGIKANTSSTDEWYWDYNQFSSIDDNLKNAKFSKTTFSWIPNEIIFDDGTKLTLD